MTNTRKRAKSWLQVAHDRGVRVEADGSIHGGSFAAVGISIINGCPECGAVVTPSGSYQAGKGDPYTYCAMCIGGHVRDYAPSRCPECDEVVRSEHGEIDARVQVGMKCGRCAYA
jgi:hypothetical protein